MSQLRAADLDAVRRQLGREPTTSFTVVARCAADGGHPLVIRNHPIDAEGDPFPTLYWLTCPSAVKAVARLESNGWIGRLNERAERDRDLAQALERAHREYTAERAGIVPEAASFGGVGGARGGLKCLHAHYANHLAGGEDPVGAWVAERVEPVHPQGPRVAAIDLGTNSIRLLVAERDPDGDLVELARDMVITRIGKDVDRTGRIRPDALDRTVAVLRRYCLRGRALHAARIRVGATSAVRDASNRADLDGAVHRFARSDLEVLTGEREAELSFVGATQGLERPAPFLVVDVGGGSTEFAFGSGGPEMSVSTQVGSVRLTERFVRHDPPSEGELASIGRAVDEVLAESESKVPARDARTLLAVSGTATTLQAVALGLARHDPDIVHGSTLPMDRARGARDRLIRMTTAERAALPVMPPGREDVIVAGAAILVRVMERWGFGEAVISEHDILDGLAVEMEPEQLT